MMLGRIGPASRALLVASVFFVAAIFDHFYLTALLELDRSYWLTDFGKQVLFSAVLLWIIIHLTGWRLHDLGIAWLQGRAALWRFLVMTIAGGAVLVLAAPFTEWLTFRLGVASAPPEYGDVFLEVLPEKAMLRFLAIACSSAVAGVFEELFYRGVLWRALVVGENGYSRRVVFVLLSAVLFGVAHSEQGLFGIVSNIMWGVVCAVLLLILRNLWPLVLGHAATNFIEFLPFLEFEASGPGPP